MTDRELLFGVMAVQLGFANASQVMGCAGEWAALQGKTSLAQLLEDRKVLLPEQRKLVEGLVEKAVQLNEGDVARTMKSLPGGGQFMLQSLTRSLVSGKHADPSRTEKSFDVPQIDSLDGTQNVCAEIVGRYELNTGPSGAEEELGRGGIGRVVVAYDHFLGRQVAIKQLLDEHTSNPRNTEAQSAALEARFLREARLTGQLEHPAIVPVYEVGRCATGGLYYTMQRVRGRTLFDALKAARSFDKRVELLPHFLQVCQAIAYAHSRGVVHRDVKPQNVMIGPFGETFLLDWGLARAKGKADPRAKDLKLAPDITGNVLEGGAIGTPSYMSPEQAEGKIDEIDERSDVWCLGAVLYELLTGRPPYEGVNPFDVLGKILKHGPPAIHSLEPKVPAELVTITVKCLRRDKRQRYATAAELAHDIEAWLSGGRVSAHAYGSVELVRRFVAHHRPSLLVAATAAVLLTVTGIQSYVRVQKERDQARQFAQLFLDDVSDKLAPLPDSRELLEQLTTRTLDYYRSTVDPKHGPRVERLRLALAWKKIGRLALKVGKGADAKPAFSFTREVVQSLLAEHPDDPEALVLMAEALVGQGDIESDEGHPAAADALYREALKNAEAAARLVSTDVSILDTHSRVLSRLGTMSLYQGQRGLALDYFQRGLEVDKRIVVLRPDDEKQLYALTLSYSQLGSVQQEVGELGGAQASYQQMLQVSQRIYERNPEHADAAFSYANALYFLGMLDLIAGRDAEVLPRLVRARDVLLEVRAHDPEAVEPIQLLSQVEIGLGNFDKGWQLIELLRKKGLGGDYTRDFLASSFLAGKWSETIALAAGASGNAELTGEIFGALAAALVGDRAAAIARAEHAASLAEQGNFQWYFLHVGNVAGRAGTAEAVLCRQLASEIEAALRKGDQRATAAALKNFAEGLKALAPR